MSKSKTAARYPRDKVAEAYEHATDPSNDHALVIVDKLFSPHDARKLAAVEYPCVDDIKAIIFGSVPALEEAWEIARKNLMIATAGALAIDPVLGRVYEEMPFVQGEGFDEFRLDDYGFVEILSAYTVLSGITRINALRYPQNVDPDRIVNDQHSLEAELLAFREEERMDHSLWEQSEESLTQGDHAIVPGLPRPTMYATASHHLNSMLLRNVWLAYDPRDGELDELIRQADMLQTSRINHRSF